MDGFLARDKDGSLCFYHYEPCKSAAGFWKCGEDEITAMLIPECEETEDTRKVLWEDEEPTKVEITIEDEEPTKVEITIKICK